MIDESGKLMVGLAMKIFYTPEILAQFKKAVVSAQANTTEAMADMLGMIVRKAIEEAQAAGAQVTNRAVMQAIAVMAKEAVELVAQSGKLPEDQAPTIAKALVAATSKSIANSKPAAAQGGQQQPAMQPAMQQQPAMQLGMPAGGM